MTLSHGSVGKVAIVLELLTLGVLIGCASVEQSRLQAAYYGLSAYGPGYSAQKDPAADLCLHPGKDWIGRSYSTALFCWGPPTQQAMDTTQTGYLVYGVDRLASEGFQVLVGNGFITEIVKLQGS